VPETGLIQIDQESRADCAAFMRESGTHRKLEKKSVAIQRIGRSA